MRILSVFNAGADTDRFLVQDGTGAVKFRTGAEVAADIGAANIAASQLRHTVKAAVTLTKGQAVYVSGADGTNMLVSKASNATESMSTKTMGLIDRNLAINDMGEVITEGLLAGLDTSTATIGDPVWLGVDGNLIYGLANKPLSPAHLVFIGIVTRVQTNNGEIFVKVQNGFELGELHDVLITGTPVDKAVIQYDTASGLWKNSALGGVTASIGTAGQVAYFTGATTQAGNNNLFWDATNFRLGIGTNAPTERLVVRAIGNSYANSAALSIENSTGANKTYLTNANGVFYISNSTTVDHLVLYANGNFAVDTNILFVDAGTNRVGIGNTSPVAKLDVTGSLGSVRVLDSGAELYFTRDGNNDLYANAGTSAGLSIGGRSYLRFFTGSASLSERMRIDPNGNIGIGTTSPIYKVDVQGTWGTVGIRSLSNTAGDILYYATGTVTGQLNAFTTSINATGSVAATLLNGNTATGSAFLDINVTSTSTGDPYLSLTTSGATNWSIGIDNSDSDKLKIGPTSNPSIGTPSLTIDTTGNVGIGTITPTHPLNIYTTVADTGILLDSNTNPSFIIKRAGVERLKLTATGAIGTINGLGNGLVFQTDSTERARFDTSGNLGIGTTTPNVRLDVNGSLDLRNAFQGYARLQPSAGNSSQARLTLRLKPLDTAEVTLGSFTQDGSFGLGGNITDIISMAGAYFSVASTGRARLNSYGGGSFSGTVAYNLAVDASGNIIETAGGVVDGSGTANYIPKWSDANTLTNSLIFDNGTNVGIGTATPSQKLDVRDGMISVQRNSDSSVVNFNIFSGVTPVSAFQINTDHTNLLSTITSRNSYVLSLATNDTERMRITSGGNVIIGSTSDTGEKLQVTGTMKVTGVSTFGSTISVSGAGNPSVGRIEFGTSAFKGILDYSAVTGLWYFNNQTAGGATTNYYQFQADGTAIMTLTKGGNLGLGVTPSAWSGVRALQVGAAASLAGFTPTGEGMYLSSNAFFNGSSWIYQTSAFASQYVQLSSIHRWYTAPSGTAGNAITFTQAMTLDASGRLLIGTSTAPSSSGIINVVAGTSSSYTQWTRTSTSIGGGAIGTDGTGLLFYSHTGAVGSETYTERARFTATNGNFHIGTFSADSGEKLQVTGTAKITGATSFGTTVTFNGSTTYNSGAVLRADNGTAAAPSISFDSDLNTGIFRAANDILGFSTAGAERIRINASGDVGIGSTIVYDHLFVSKITGSSIGIGMGGAAGTVASPIYTYLNFRGYGDAIKAQLSSYDVSSNVVGGMLAFSVQNTSAVLTEYMRITSTGNVGIGTASPSSSLQINKSAQTIGGTTPNGALIVSSLAAGNAILEIGVAPTFLSYIQSRNVTSNTVYQLLLNPDGGNVGVGATIPSSTLHVSRNSATFQVSDTAKTANNTLSIFALTQTSWAIGTGASGTFSGSEKIVITDGGNIGIGTGTPGGKIHVVGSESRFGGVASGFISLYNANTRSGYIQANQAVDLRIASDTDPMTFYVGGSERMRIDANGNLGIATTNPGNDKLSVVGSGRFTAGLTSSIGFQQYAHYFYNGGGTNDIFASTTGNNAGSGNFAIVNTTAGSRIALLGSATGTVRIGNNTQTAATATAFVVDLATNYVGIGTATPKRHLDVSTTGSPEIVLGALSGGVDQKYWRAYAASDIFRIGNVNDAFSAGTDVLAINRSNNVGIGTTSINTAAKLQVDSTTSGFLPPRMTAAQRTAISTPPEGLIIFQTDGVVGLYLYVNSAWKSLAIVN